MLEKGQTQILSHMRTHTHTTPDWFSFSPNLQGCDLAYVPAVARGVNRWSSGWCEWLDIQHRRGSTFCHNLRTNSSLIAPGATDDFWVILIKSWNWLIAQISLAA